MGDLTKSGKRPGEETITENVWLKFNENSNVILRFEPGSAHVPPDAIEATLTYSVKAKGVTRYEIEELLNRGSHTWIEVSDIFRRLLSHGLADSGGGK